MLRRRFLIRVGVLIGAFVLGSAGAIWALQTVLADVERANADAATLIDGIQRVETILGQIEAARYDDPPTDPAPLAGQLDEAMRRLAAHPVTAPGGRAGDAFARLTGAIPPFLAAWTDPSPPSPPYADPDALRARFLVQRAAHEAGVVFRAFVAQEQRAVGRSFRGMVLVLTLAALVMVNVAVVVLLRTAEMVLKPVAALTEGSRLLAAERFDHRVRVRPGDEFAELAHAYNWLAERLQANEERKVEALRHLAVALNHDLNNALAVIELQLALLDRETAVLPGLPDRLREIRGSLARMARTVASLKNIRRVVLTDYAPGQKMVDLDRSLDLPGEPASGAARP